MSKKVKNSAVETVCSRETHSTKEKAFKEKSKQEKKNKEKESTAQSETGEVVPTFKKFIHPLWSFHVLGLFPF